MGCYCDTVDAVLQVSVYNPGHQNCPKAIYSMVFGPKSLNI